MRDCIVQGDRRNACLARSQRRARGDHVLRKSPMPYVDDFAIAHINFGEIAAAATSRTEIISSFVEGDKAAKHGGRDIFVDTSDAVCRKIFQGKVVNFYCPVKITHIGIGRALDRLLGLGRDAFAKTRDADRPVETEVIYL